MKQICKECNLEKELSDFYKHPQGKNGVLGRCKECIKAGRRSEKERIMARVNDRKRNKKTERKKSRIGCTKIYRENNPEKYKAHQLIQKYYSKNKRPTTCVSCRKEGKLELHHEDYSKPNEIIPLCSLCHKARHKGTIEIMEEWIFTLLLY